MVKESLEKQFDFNKLNLKDRKRLFNLNYKFLMDSFALKPSNQLKKPNSL